jgi:hypothetical protein
MICSQCTTELPAMAPTCPECGSSIPRGQSTTFSYLPPGTPSWPVRVPEKLPYLVESKAGKQFKARAKANVKVKNRASSLTRRIISIVLILLITPLLGILTTIGIFAIQGRFPPNSHASPSSLSRLPGTSGNANPFSSSASVLPPPTASKLTSDATMNISVQCPSDWTVGPADQSGNPDITEFPITQPGQLIRMYIARFSNNASSQISGPDDLNSALIGQMSQQFSGVTTVTSPNASPTIGSDQWMAQDATYMGRDLTKSHFATITVLHNHQNYYNINFVVPQSLYEQAMQDYIQPILNSFKFSS